MMKNIKPFRDRSNLQFPCDPVRQHGSSHSSEDAIAVLVLGRIPCPTCLSGIRNCDVSPEYRSQESWSAVVIARRVTKLSSAISQIVLWYKKLSITSATNTPYHLGCHGKFSAKAATIFTLPYFRFKCPDKKPASASHAGMFNNPAGMANSTAIFLVLPALQPASQNLELGAAC